MRSIAKEALSTHIWDCILCSHVLEHVSNPIETLLFLLSLMHSHTLLYIEVPYENYWDIPWYRRYYSYLRSPKKLFKKRAIGIHEHINMFRERTFKTIASLYNLKILYLEQGKCSIHCLVQKYNTA